MKAAIEVENLSKKFRIDHSAESYLSIRDSLKNIFKRKSTEDFYALKDINFTVNEGDTVGIIGRNGAGKSTLLKIISKITPPTTGSITYRGRVASLLEVGTGFHGELTGRENVFMNGSILGMKRSEIVKNFDAIVDFAGVEKFIDTPLKHYSSGMQVRLAFAVAAFLENEILIIDEVLAVGDAEFQKKCLGKMHDVAHDGRTVIFVSHNMQAVKTLCNRGIVLEAGGIVESGEVEKCLERYYNLEKADSSLKQFAEADRPQSEWAELVGYGLKGKSGDYTSSFNLYDNATLEVEYRIKELSGSKDAFLLNLHIYDRDNNYFFVASVKLSDGVSAVGTYKTTFELPNYYFNTGFYRIGIALTSYPGTLVHFFLNPAFSFEVTEDDLGLRDIPYNGKIPGLTRLSLPYKHIQL